uniref:Solute carrier family 7 member 14 n=1 Tax=Apteryx owenii TaxID=8824 RepID=A0A8B9SCN9_APTOW
HAPCTPPVESMLEGAGEGAKLARVLTTLDLISLGVGSCVGTGMYVVSGLVAKEMAGPGVIVSFIIAAVASILSGVCYAEFGVRVPKTTGSAYTYSYVTVGEFVAFFIGWNLILEYLIGTAAGASALSSMFDSLANHTISHWMINSTYRHLFFYPGKGEESYPDLLALVIAVIVTIIVAMGVKNSVGLNNVLNVINLAVWIFIMIAGLFFVKGDNWSEGQFLPFGWPGVSIVPSVSHCVLKGAATCFYAFIGFDIIATTGEEAKSPNTSIPYAITASLVTCLTAYVSVSIILTLMVPYDAIDTESPLMEMFVARGFYAAKFIVAIGSVAGLTVSLLGSLFPMPRVIYAMAGDGLLFRFLSHVSSYTETPVVACIVSGFLAALLSLLVSLRDLIEMMSIGTLLAYTLVSVCVLLLRYQPERSLFSRDKKSAILKKLIGPRYYTMRIHLGLPGKMDRPTVATGHTVTTCVLLLFVLMFIFCSFIIFGADYIYEQSWWAVLLVVLMILLIVVLVFVILQQPENPKKLPYMAPCLPFVPAFAMLVNIYLMLKLSTVTWIRFAVWCFVGLLIYFGYGMWNSTLEISAREEALHQSTYQRYDVDVDPFSVDDGFSYANESENYQDWGPSEDKGFSYQQMAGAKESHRTSSKPKSKGKHKQNSEALIANDELDYSPE